MKAIFNAAAILILSLVVAAPLAYAQKSDRELRRELSKNADKASRKEAKQYTKEGWGVMPGKLPLDQQIRNAKYSELDENADGTVRYFTGSDKSTGGNYTAAKQIAHSRAASDIAGKVYTEIRRLVDDRVANDNFGGKDVTVIDEFISANKHVVEAELQGIETVVEMFREIGDGKYEMYVLVRIDAQKALQMCKKGYYNLLRQKSQQLADEFDKML